jgi:catechol 2,3-dioxygenase-like lactoylglutathione lyase family enzyme
MTAPPPPIDGVLETVLYARDLERASAFYQEVLGFRLIAGDGRRFQGFHASGRQVLLIFQHGATLEPAPATVSGMIPPHDGSGAHHIGFAIAAENYEPWKWHLAAAGVLIESEARWERGGRSLYFRDPDGHLLELVTPGIWHNY